MALELRYEPATGREARVIAHIPARRVARVNRWFIVAATSSLIVGDLGSLSVGFFTPESSMSSLQDALVILAIIAAAAAAGLYRLRISPSVVRDAGPIVVCLAVPAAIAALAFGGPRPERLMQRLALSFALILAVRAVVFFLIKVLRSRRSLADRTLIIGAGSVGAGLARVLVDHPEFGLNPVGVLDSFDDADLPLPILGNVGNLDSILAKHSIRRAVIAFGATREPDMVKIVRTCDRASVDIHVLPRLFELGFSGKGRDVEDVWGYPLVRLRRAALRSQAWGMKRLFDIAASGTILLLISPLYAAIALAVRLSSPGPVYLRQQRIGQRGHVVEILKFRSMRENNDSDTQWSVSDDDRITGIGKIIRKTSLDELPQLWNVLKGDMSLVGPRPERPFFVDQFKVSVPGYADRHRVPVGMTGLSQINGLRGDTSIDERARMDNAYIENWSLWTDLEILAKTFSAVIRHARKGC